MKGKKINNDDEISSDEDDDEDDEEDSPKNVPKESSSRTGPSRGSKDAAALQISAQLAPTEEKTKRRK